MSSGECGCCCKNACPTTAFALTAIVASSIFSFYCKSVKIEALDDVDGVELLVDARDLRFGPWTMTRSEIVGIGPGLNVEREESCVEWDYNPQIDTKWAAVRAFTILTFILGILLTLVVSMADCLRPSHIAPLWRPISGCFLIVLPLFQGLTFLIFKSNVCQDNSVANAFEKLLQIRANTTEPFYDDECSWDEGSSANVAAIIAWFFAGISMIIFNAPPQDDPDDYSSDEEEEEEDDEKDQEDADKKKEENVDQGPAQMAGAEGEEEVITA